MRKGWIYRLKLLLISTVAITTIVQIISHPTRHLLLLPLAAMATMEISCDTTSPEDYTEVPPDTCPWWDTDCDGISNAVETNDANSYLDLDTAVVNANPSIARGKPCSTDCVGTKCGWITNALNMVNTGTGYWHYNPEKRAVDHDDWGTLHLIYMIEAAGRTWHDNNCVPPRINVGDLSKGDTATLLFGGYFPPHICHQNGREVDIRYVRNDEQDEPLNVRTQPSLYDLPGTLAVIEWLLENGNVNKIIVSPHSNLDLTGYDVDTVSYDASGGHDDHFHLRIEDPDGTGN
jgi:hypothetical protein